MTLQEFPWEDSNRSLKKENFCVSGRGISNGAEPRDGTRILKVL